MELTARMRTILSLLLAASGYVTAEHIAAELGVSARTVTREMHGIETALKPYGVMLLRRTGAGFMLSGDAAALGHLRTELSLADVHSTLTPDQRRSILITRLLMADEPLKLFALAHLLHVTDSTVSHDLDRLQPWLAAQQITLVRRPGLGVYVEGAERDIRRALVRIIHDYVDEKELLALIGDDAAEEGPAYAADRALLGLVDPAQIRRIDDAVAAETQDRNIPDSARVGLVVHLALAVRRLQQGDTIVMDAGTLEELRQTEEFSVAETIAARMGEVFSISIPAAEIGYITMHLLGARGMTLPSGGGRVDNFRLVQIAQSIMRRASEKSGAPLMRSRTLLTGLVNHLAPALHRLKLHMYIRNPLLAQMEEEHPELMEIARHAIPMMEEEAGMPVPDDEVAYIAIHIGAALTEAGGDRPAARVLVACPTGLGTSRLLASRLRLRADSCGRCRLLACPYRARNSAAFGGLRGLHGTAFAASCSGRCCQCVFDGSRSGTDRCRSCRLQPTSYGGAGGSRTAAVSSSDGGDSSPQRIDLRSAHRVSPTGKCIGGIH